MAAAATASRSRNKTAGSRKCFPKGFNGKTVARFRGSQWLEILGTSQTLNLGSEYTIVYVSRGVAGTLLSKGSGGKAGQFSLLSDSCFLTNGELNASSGGRWRPRAMIRPNSAFARSPRMRPR